MCKEIAAWDGGSGSGEGKQGKTRGKGKPLEDLEWTSKVQETQQPVVSEVQATCGRGFEARLVHVVFIYSDIVSFPVFSFD